jgi:hypothetical protein
MVVKGYDLDVAFKRVTNTVKWLAASLVFLYGLYTYDVYSQRRASERQAVVCPSFLSIARSARDTLIVMRNEPLCNRYVLDNLQ